MKSWLRYCIDDFLLLPLGGLLAIAWANVAPESYFSVAQPLAFWVNDVALTLFFAFITQEVVEEMMPGGALHSWRRWLLPVAAAAGALAGAAGVYLLYVHWRYELVLGAGWPAAAAIDIAVVYVLVKALFGRHPAVAFVLVAAVAVDVIGLAAVASRQHLVHVEAGGASMMLIALVLAAIMRLLKVRSFWPFVLLCGPLSWWALYGSGINPALALVPLMPFVKHTPRSVLFEDRPHKAHRSLTHFEHVFRYPVHAILFLFGLVNAGVLLAGYGTGTWALLAAALIGKPMGLLIGTAAGLALGLQLPRGLHWRDLGVVAMATAGGFAFALFFATSVYPPGPLLAELKLGTILGGVGVPLTIALAWFAKTGRFHAPAHRRPDARVGHAVAGALLALLLCPSSTAAQDREEVTQGFDRQVNAYLELRRKAREDVAPTPIIDPRIREIGCALLAARIRQLRPYAAEGDVFSEAMAALIRDRLHRAFDPREVDALFESLYPGGLPATGAAHVNFGCAKDVLVPPPVGVLAALPPVAGVLGYRLAGGDLVLWDEEASIVVDVLRDALPEPRIWDFLDLSSVELRHLISASLRRSGLDPFELLEENEAEAPPGWSATVGERFWWRATGVMPPTLLRDLPLLPPPLEYRFAGADLVVVNVDTSMVIGVLRNALPRRSAGLRAWSRVFNPRLSTLPSRARRLP
jgi:NhaA family Na+:H+ antiporter